MRERKGDGRSGAAPGALARLGVMHPMRPAGQLDDPDVHASSSSPFRAAFGRARFEALAPTAAPAEPLQQAVAPVEAARFEYLLLKRRGKRSAEEAAWNALGREGWELVGMTGRHAAFKRLVRSLPSPS